MREDVGVFLGCGLSVGLPHGRDVERRARPFRGAHGQLVALLLGFLEGSTKRVTFAVQLDRNPSSVTAGGTGPDTE